MIEVARYDVDLDPDLTQLLRETIERSLRWKERLEKIHAERKEKFSFDFVEELTQALHDIGTGKKLYVGRIVSQAPPRMGRPPKQPVSAPPAEEGVNYWTGDSAVQWQHAAGTESIDLRNREADIEAIRKKFPIFGE
jgi:hypothetical protein